MSPSHVMVSTSVDQKTSICCVSNAPLRRSTARLIQRKKLLKKRLATPIHRLSQASGCTRGRRKNRYWCKRFLIQARRDIASSFTIRATVRLSWGARRWFSEKNFKSASTLSFSTVSGVVLWMSSTIASGLPRAQRLRISRLGQSSWKKRLRLGSLRVAVGSPVRLSTA